METKNFLALLQMSLMWSNHDMQYVLECRLPVAIAKELLEMSHLPSLSDRRLYLKPCSVLKIIRTLCYFPPLFSVRETRSHINRPYLLKQPFARTNFYIYSFVPHSVSQWNGLPISVVSSPSLSVFKESLRQVLW